MRRISLIVAAWGLLLLIAGNARADLLDVATGSWTDVGTGTETWNRGANPSGSVSITIPIINNTSAGSQTPTMFGWALGIEILGGTSGSLSVNGPTNPSSNALNGSPGSPGLFVGNPSGPNEYFVISNTNNTTVGSQVPTSGTNLVTFNLTSNNAVGTYQIYAFNDASNGYSNWTYYNAGNPADPNNGNDFAFQSVSASGAFPPTETRFLLGTITVLGPAAVPEPGSMILAGIASAGFAGYGWRRKRREASALLGEGLLGEGLPVDGTLDDAVPLADSATNGGLSA